MHYLKRGRRVAQKNERGIHTKVAGPIGSRSRSNFLPLFLVPLLLTPPGAEMKVTELYLMRIVIEADPSNSPNPIRVLATLYIRSKRRHKVYLVRTYFL